MENKQETLEEFINSQPHYGSCTTEYVKGIKEGAKWQMKRSYSEEDIALAFNEGQAYSVTGKLVDGKEWVKEHKKEWFNEFKNK